ncbi:chemotaxis protein CheW [Falsibacillus albus]|uniref:Chemotaxis protein CheW n=1 Tax=Falsibacillus albus TaxID=2478915 RepID=A0A3L7JLE5_9BACI|nr:chemotaxis protein CheW [Falsibacillus albus]RLQ91125.1 chemotaxis protein CheW [Falsibacillus albus]
MNEKAIIFKVNEEEYGIPINYVISIEKLPDIKAIPHLPHYVKGIVKVRGELLPVLDFEELLYEQSLQKDEHSRMIVLQTEKISIGLLVREAKEIIDIPSERLKQVGLMGYQSTKYFSGVANMEDGLITMIDPDILVSTLEGIKEIQEYVSAQETV